MCEFRSVTKQELASAGLRYTIATQQLLAIFEQEKEMLLTHSDINQLLCARRFVLNKVSLYRLLDRLVAVGILERVVDHDRIARYCRRCPDAVFSPRFECQTCLRHFRLSQLPPDLSDALQQAFTSWATQGYQSMTADMAIRGVCAQCISSA